MPPVMGYHAAPLVIPPSNSLDACMLVWALEYVDASSLKVASSGDAAYLC